MRQRLDPPTAPSTLWHKLQCSPRRVMAVVVWAAVLLLVAATAERRAAEAVGATTALVSPWRVPYFSDGPCLMSGDDETAACGSDR